MRLDDVIEETAFSVSSNKVRSALTILGIVVGIASVIVMVAIGQGAQASITNSIQSGGLQPHHGDARVWRWRRCGRAWRAWGRALADRGRRGGDRERRSRVSPACLAGALVRQQVIAGANNTNTQIHGCDARVRDGPQRAGRRGHVPSAGQRRVGRAGGSARADDARRPVRRRGQRCRAELRINGIDFRVVGVTRRRAAPVSTTKTTSSSFR